MTVKSLHIISFGGLKNRDIELSAGVNVLGGDNESGKTSAAMFIKFIFYGLSSKSTKSGGASERVRFVNRETMQASGFIIAQTDSGTPYRLERTLILSDNSPARERVRIINLTTGETVSGQNPGDYFFGVPEDIFVSTCFVSQSAAIKPDIAKLDSAISSSDASSNLLSSGSEDIDVKRGLKKLENLRRELCHKNGDGGEISELREKRDALSRELGGVSERAAEIIAAGSSLDDINKRVSELEEARDKYNSLFYALEKIVVKRRIDALNQTKAKLESAKSQIEGIASSPLGPSAEEALNDAERDIHAYDELVIAYDEEYSDFEDDEEESPVSGISGDAEDDIDEAHSLYNDSRTKLALSVAMMISGVLGLGAFVVLYLFNTDLYSIPLIITLALVTLGVVFISRYIKVKNRLSDILEKWEAESIDSLENAVEDKLSRMSQMSREADEKEKKLASLEAAKLRFDAADSLVTSLAESSGIARGDSVYETIGELRGRIDSAKKKKAELTSLAQKLSGRLDALLELIDGVDIKAAEAEAQKLLVTEIGRKAASLGSEEVKEAVRERDFTENALKSALKRKSALEERLSELGKLNHTPDEYQSMINSLDEKIEELSLRHDACELAIQVISAAGESMRSGINTRLAQSASEMLKSCTPHGKLSLDTELNPSLESGSARLTAEILSRGTADLTYLSLRNALCGEMFGEEKPITVFDESFAHIDIERTRNFFRALSGGQYLILTCREDEISAAKSLGMNTVQM